MDFLLNIDISTDLSFYLNELKAQIPIWLTYDPSNRLLFSTPLFLGLFLGFFTIYSILRSGKYFFARKIYIIIFSLFFYYKGGGNFYLLLLGSAILSQWMSKLMYQQDNPKKRKIWLIVIVIINIGLLIYYKYTNFFIDNVNNIFSRDFSKLDLVIPIGISFFVFEAISYSVDLYRKQLVPAKSTLDYIFYITFFPKLVMGPIIRAKDFLPQIYQKVSLSHYDAGHGVYLFLIGLIKKTVICDYISVNFVERVFENPSLYNPFQTLMGVYGFSLQIYCDFSGYSDMAIGLALLLGFKIPRNFHTPYKSKSITEFWRRWHISLSSWLRDYLYISLGGNRKGIIRTYLNKFLTMLIGGLWHGASWTFVIWGGLHGLALVIEQYLKQFIKIPINRIVVIIRIFITFNFVSFCWIFFKADSFSSALDIISNITSLRFNIEDWWKIILASKPVFIFMAIGYFLHFLPERLTDSIKDAFISLPLVIKGLILGFVFWIVFLTAGSAPQSFIYFDF